MYAEPPECRSEKMRAYPVHLGNKNGLIREIKTTHAISKRFKTYYFV